MNVAIHRLVQHNMLIQPKNVLFTDDEAISSEARCYDGGYLSMPSISSLTEEQSEMLSIHHLSVHKQINETQPTGGSAVQVDYLDLVDDGYEVADRILNPYSFEQETSRNQENESRVCNNCNV